MNSMSSNMRHITEAIEVSDMIAYTTTEAHGGCFAGYVIEVRRRSYVGTILSVKVLRLNLPGKQNGEVMNEHTLGADGFEFSRETKEDYDALHHIPARVQTAIYEEVTRDRIRTVYTKKLVLSEDELDVKLNLLANVSISRTRGVRTYYDIIRHDTEGKATMNMVNSPEFNMAFLGMSLEDDHGLMVGSLVVYRKSPYEPRYVQEMGRILSIWAPLEASPVILIKVLRYAGDKRTCEKVPLVDYLPSSQCPRNTEVATQSVATLRLEDLLIIIRPWRKLGRCGRLGIPRTMAVTDESSAPTAS